MKNSILVILFLSIIIVGCGDSESGSSESKFFKKCPRVDLEWVLSDQISDRADELASELTNVINCGRAFNHPICGEGDLFEDSATVTVDEWCTTFIFCPPCQNFPNGFTIAEQNDLIADAKALLALEMTTCGIEEASYVFDIEESEVCDGRKYTLVVTGTALCCASVE